MVLGWGFGRLGGDLGSRSLDWFRAYVYGLGSRVVLRPRLGLQVWWLRVFGFRLERFVGFWAFKFNV